MREDESNWFSKWEDELPRPDELMPLSQTLISTDLALAFNIQSPQTHHHRPSPPPPPPAAVSMTPNSAEFDSSDFAAGGSGGGGAAGDEPARTLKRPRLVWTPQLHKRFVDAVAHLGIKNAVPKTIMQLMSVDGLTRENVASHLQKYRLYLKRMQGISSGGGGGGGSGDSATDHLFASSPVPPHFLHPQGRPAADHFMPFVQVAAIQQQQQSRHLAMGAGNSSQFPAQYGQIGHFGQVEHPFLARQPQAHGVHRLGGNTTYMEDVDSGTHANGRKVLTLFPTGED